MGRKGKLVRCTVKLTPPVSGPSLKQQGVDKNLAKLARKAAAVPVEKFEADVAKSVAIAVASIEGNAAEARTRASTRRTAADYLSIQYSTST